MRNRVCKLGSIIATIMLLFFSFSQNITYAQTNTEGDPPDNPGVKEEQTDIGEKGMVVTAHPEATEIGAEVLRQGGNAMDAAAAIQLALNVVEPQMSGIGGGGFIMYYDAETKEVFVLNSREKAPGGATEDMFIDPETGDPFPFADRVESGLSVGVPGTLKGLEDGLKEWGTMSLEELIDPAIELAEEGHNVNWALANAIESNATKLSKTEAGKVFVPNGQPLKEGDLLVQEDLAKTFKLIKEKGTDVFYNGEIAQSLVDEVQDNGGSMDMQDLKQYSTDMETPVKGNYKGYDIYSMPPPSSGGLVVIQLLSMFEQLDLTQWDIRSTEKYHHLVEAYHLAYADRGQYMGDENYIDVPKNGLIHPEYIAKRIALIDPNKANDNVEPGNPCEFETEEIDDVCADYASVEDESKQGEEGSTEETELNGEEDEKEEAQETKGEYDQEENEEATNDGEISVENNVEEEEGRVEGETTHFTVADQWGNMVSFTTTIEQVFGSGMMVPGYGVMLNNELTDFDATPGGANQVEPNKRPLSSMSPTIVLKDGEPFMTVGSPGGTTIITSVAQVILNVIGYDQELKDAIEEPRLFSSAYPSIRWEYGVPGDVREKMIEMGHEWEEQNLEIGNVNSLLIKDNMYYGAADSTREGVAIGLTEEDFAEEIDVTKLEEALKEAEKLNKSDYTKKSWEKLDDAIKSAQNLLSDEQKTQEEVDATLKKLNEAMNELEKKQKDVDKSTLEKEVKQAEKLNEADYTKDSWDKFQAVLKSAQTILSKENATEKEVKEALTALKNSVKELKLKDKKEPNDAKEIGESNTNNNEQIMDGNNAETTIVKNDNDDTNKKGGILPNTGTAIFNILLIGVGLLIVGVILFVIRKRKVS
ncbi:MAG TPA: gamma-glutamyltransferase [Candidatus Pseudogracilibacillus intestinigallinarum]|uniref:Gamma-glutamyltransferase n=1 Tax=Candidatus Pseudogracilibacillus intestinigallinarum TaxID=2838742 RepID=A0A9D1PLQ1_9BACI|nr:gamma-glutamyltransferase [Candidatus Pseudogracilibacillus intestinigallinarum]